MTLFMVLHKQTELLCKTDLVNAAFLRSVYLMFHHFTKQMYFGYIKHLFVMVVHVLLPSYHHFFSWPFPEKTVRIFTQHSTLSFVSLQLWRVMMLPCSKVLKDSSGKCAPYPVNTTLQS